MRRHHSTCLSSWIYGDKDNEICWNRKPCLWSHRMCTQIKPQNDNRAPKMRLWLGRIVRLLFLFLFAVYSIGIHDDREWNWRKRLPRERERKLSHKSFRTINTHDHEHSYETNKKRRHSVQYVSSCAFFSFLSGLTLYFLFFGLLYFFFSFNSLSKFVSVQHRENRV